MATWRVEPTWKKSIIERNYLTKDGNTVMVETGWRGGSFYVFTDDDNPPELESGVDIYNCDYETELIETFDGCWEDHDFDDCDDETREWLEEFFDDGNSWLDLEEQGWSQDECEMIIDCDLKITRINDDDSDGESFVTGEQVLSDTEDQDDEESQESNDDSWPFPTGGMNAISENSAKFSCVNCNFETENIEELTENTEDDGRGAFLCPKCNSNVEMG